MIAMNAPNGRQTPDTILDLYPLLVALGDRAVNSVWQGSDLDCFGETAEELCSLTDDHQPIAGQDLLRLAAGVTQTIDGTFKAYDQGATSHWISIRAWDGSGFYIEIDDPELKERLKSQFHAVEEIAEAPHPYEGLFVPAFIPDSSPPKPAAKPPFSGIPAWDPLAFAEANRKSTALVSAFFLIDSWEAISECIQWLALLRAYQMPAMEDSHYFDELRAIYEARQQVINFDHEFRLTWKNQEFQAFLRCHFFDPGRYEIELLLPGVIADEIADHFKDGKDGFWCAFMPPMFYD
jgi:hypothetical protein